MSNISHHVVPNYVPAVRASAEKEVGILHYVSPVDFAWYGDIRKRYTDFQVNEILRDGTVLHLQDFELPEENKATKSTPATSGPAVPPKPAQPDVPTQERSCEPSPIKEEDLKALKDLIPEDGVNKLQDIYARIQGNSDGPLKAEPVIIATVADRQTRGLIHREIRRIFLSRIETSVESNGDMTAVPFVPPRRGGQQTGGRGMGSSNWRSNNGSQGQRRGPAKRTGGEYLHFTLYKENKDTMDAINHLARMLKSKSTSFGFAGTKDRRAATVQRVSVWHQAPENMAWLNKRLPTIKVGDFEYSSRAIQLGQHGGNQFVIVVKNVYLGRGQNCSLAHRLEATKQCVDLAVKHLFEHGFLNYFGLQRFGTHTIGTQEIGKRILKEEFESAVDALLHIDPNLAFADPEIDVANRDEINRARGIAVWKSTGNAKDALDLLPKRYSAETSIIRHIGRNKESRRDFCGALLAITRGLRQMYIHAYQSLVWNFVASKRWAMYGSKVIKGDLVVVENDGQILGQAEEGFYQEARPLSAEEAGSGKYSIFDVVLPTPGFDVVYPDNEIGEFYAEFMSREENGRLNPYDMRRRQKEFSLSGGYRKVLARFNGMPAFEVRAYADDNEQMHPTDLDLIKQRKADRETSVSRDPAASAWNSFSQNAGAHDAALSREMQEERRRRRRIREATPETETRINDTWVQTALDGTLKRQKLGMDLVRHTAVEENPEYSGDRATTPEKSAVQTKEEPDEPLQPIASSGTSNFMGTTISSAGLVVNITGEPVVSDGLSGQKKAATPEPSGPGFKHEERELYSGLYMDGGGSSKPAEPARQHQHQHIYAGTEAALPEPEVKPATAALPALLSQPEHDMVEPRGSSPPVPGGAGGAGVATSAEKSKIAVALTFKLASSSYATIALRELMGTVSPETPVTGENKGGSHGPGHGFPGDGAA